MSETATLKGLQHFINYDHWANREVLSSFRNADPLPARPLQLMSHIIGAEVVWLSRLRNEKSSLAVWPELSVGDCAKYFDNLFKQWSEFLERLRPEEMTNVITYKNSKGETWSSSIEDIVTHVAFHSAYHRGQIASEMRAHGYTPAYTDYIHGVRQGLIE